jgi:hypothetical protein
MEAELSLKTKEINELVNSRQSCVEIVFSKCFFEILRNQNMKQQSTS